MFKLMALVLFVLCLMACSEESNKVEEHVWQDQTDMIDKAKGVEKILNDVAIKQYQLIDKQTN